MKYVLGRILYIMALALLYVLFLAVIPVVINIRQIGFSSDWGKVLGTYIAERFLENGLVGSANIVRYLSVGEAMAASLFLGWAAMCMIGLTIYLAELITGRNESAVLMAGILIVIDYLGYSAFFPEFNRFRWFYPLFWCDVAHLRYGSYLHAPTLTYALTATVIVLAGLILLIIAGAWLQYKGGNRWKRTKR